MFVVQRAFNHTNVATTKRYTIGQILSSANTTILHARAIFASRLGRLHRNRLPSGLDGFLHQSLMEVPVQRKVAIPFPVMRALFKKIARLEHTDPAVHQILLLALYAGLRANEIIFMRWMWLCDATERPTIHVRSPRGQRIVKQGRARAFPIAVWLFYHLREWRGPSEDHVLPGAEKNRRAAYRRAVAFLRAHGLQGVTNPLHFLRSLSLTSTAEELDLLAAQQQAGHGTLDMTYARYLQLGFTARHLRLALEGPGRIARRYRRRPWPPRAS